MDRRNDENEEKKWSKKGKIDKEGTKMKIQKCRIEETKLRQQKQVFKKMKGQQ